MTVTPGTHNDMQSTGHTIDEKPHPPNPARRILAIATWLYAAQLAAAAVAYGVVGANLLSGKNSILTPMLCALALTGLLGLACRAAARRTSPTFSHWYRAAANQSASLCLIHAGLLSVMTVLLDDAAESLALLGLAFSGTALVWAYQALRQLAALHRQPGSTKPPAAEEDGTARGAQHYVTPLHQLAGMPEGQSVYVSAGALYLTGGGTLMLDGTAPASNMPTTEHALKLVRHEHGFIAVGLDEGTADPPRTLRNHEMPEHSFVVTNQ
jgi:hypothetical protein